MGLYAEWKKLRDNVQSASARLYSEKNENTERKYEEALEMLGQFEKENGIPLMAEEAEVKKMFCPQTNEEWFCQLPTEEKARWLYDHYVNARADEYYGRQEKTLSEYQKWLVSVHREIDGTKID